MRPTKNRNFKVSTIAHPKSTKLKFENKLNKIDNNKKGKQTIVREVNIFENATEDNNGYYNIRITNTTGELTPATFRENRTVPILTDPSQFELAIARFTVPALNIPIFLWSNVENKLFVTLRDITGAGVDFKETVQFIPNATTPDLYGDSIWNYQEFVDSVNNALAAAFLALKTANPGVTPVATPYLTYTAESQLISLFAETTYTGEIEVYFNDLLYSNFFPSFQSIADFNNVGAEYKLYIKDNKNNTNAVDTSIPVGYYKMKQEYSTLFLWNAFQSIVFETDTIPVESEDLPFQTDVRRRVLTDFEPEVASNNRQAFQYFPQGPLRYYDLKSVYPMTSIDIKIFWEDKNGVTYPIYIQQNEVATVKISFKRKTANF